MVKKSLKHLYEAKHDHFLGVNFEFYKKWKWVIKAIMHLNKEYVPCEIFRKKYKGEKNLVIVGLKWAGQNVKRRTSGIAKDFVHNHHNPKCIYCDNTLTEENATSDHIIPISLKGSNCQVNLTVCCKKCNNERGVTPFDKFIRSKNPKYRNIKHIFV